ncbi:class I SAM-dependent methyltransferase [Pararhodobacter oceanensis]|uniref:SAM-dependent methyltransferase n=1 Tax=Pararhodobacter oceanensis TaxID=2172121 RepID=A0A2T8HSA1_9RHOB|nr:class I SAM-dependent methyltransferase [Pararhodobacter oceanensis]PVH28318.1 SAM-dependent methyltransferase [Pararhodobacter oceanensis]
MTSRQEHWDAVYSSSDDAALTWFEDRPDLSLQVIRQIGLPDRARAELRAVDVGGGTSRLVDALLDDGLRDLTVLDLSAEALQVSQDRLGARASLVQWITGDVTEWRPETRFDLWHDRALFHFLTDPETRAAYIRTMTLALCHGGMAVIGTFASDGPQRCSNLPVMRYSAEELAQEIGEGFEPLVSLEHIHETPIGQRQPFVYLGFRRR